MFENCTLECFQGHQVCGVMDWEWTTEYQHCLPARSCPIRRTLLSITALSWLGLVLWRYKLTVSTYSQGCNLSGKKDVDATLTNMLKCLVEESLSGHGAGISLSHNKKHYFFRVLVALFMVMQRIVSSGGWQNGLGRGVKLTFHCIKWNIWSLTANI